MGHMTSWLKRQLVISVRVMEGVEYYILLCFPFAVLFLPDIQQNICIFLYKKENMCWVTGPALDNLV